MSLSPDPVQSTDCPWCRSSVCALAPHQTAAGQQNRSRQNVASILSQQQQQQQQQRDTAQQTLVPSALLLDCNNSGDLGVMEASKQGCMGESVNSNKGPLLSRVVDMAGPDAASLAPRKAWQRHIAFPGNKFAIYCCTTGAVLTSKWLNGARPFLGAPGQGLPGLPSNGSNGAFGVSEPSSLPLATGL
jgi:hypothetical protein